ncbi:class I SAM-dependent methyltransferase [Allomesorhizobium camelthorni]|uniref:Class I SAM-dependent methyltransferase n=1 Tax=Allomesorhizobium camelthorni TaxID=475069 RepID=A0A6G4WBB0_9HYPH|nr:class I SAM-dependent methyltransferase [Mesorhizobium camelthorni]NGO52051.1 class I SAM-dependent methyltransferase [Mesorhizobium camelthorni]
MTRDVLKTLFHPFEAEALAAPGEGRRVLFLGAQSGFRLPEGFDADLSLVQGFRPWFRALAGRYKITPQPEGENFDVALVLAGRHRGENELRIAEAIERTKGSGLILIAGGKDDGIASLRKRMEGLVELEGHMPKHHGVAFWFQRPLEISEPIAALRDGNGETLIEGRFVTAPGMFSSDRIDAGSKLLAAHLPDKISGAVADFCAGWGFLAAELANRYSKISMLDLYEADFVSLEAAKRNVAATGTVEPRFFWHDLLTEEVPHRYDFIVMNPPFHQKREAEPDIGQRMIRTASAALKPGGRLLMVANRQLPYEKTLSEAFSSHSEIVRDGLFKVLAAKR